MLMGKSGGNMTMTLSLCGVRINWSIAGNPAVSLAMLLILGTLGLPVGGASEAQEESSFEVFDVPDRNWSSTQIAQKQIDILISRGLKSFLDDPDSYIVSEDQTLEDIQRLVWSAAIWMRWAAVTGRVSEFSRARLDFEGLLLEAEMTGRVLLRQASYNESETGLFFFNIGAARGHLSHLNWKLTGEISSLADAFESIGSPGSVSDLDLDDMDSLGADAGDILLLLSDYGYRFDNPHILRGVLEYWLEQYKWEILRYVDKAPKYSVEKLRYGTILSRRAVFDLKLSFVDENLVAEQEALSALQRSIALMQPEFDAERLLAVERTYQANYWIIEAALRQRLESSHRRCPRAAKRFFTSTDEALVEASNYLLMLELRRLESKHCSD